MPRRRKTHCPQGHPYMRTRDRLKKDGTRAAWNVCDVCENSRERKAASVRNFQSRQRARILARVEKSLRVALAQIEEYHRG